MDTTQRRAEQEPKYQAEMNVIDNASAAEENYNNTNSSESNAIKNDGRLDTNLGLLNSYFSEKWSFNSELKLGMAFEEDNGFQSSIKSAGNAKRSVAEFIPRLDLSAVRSSCNSIHLFNNHSGFGSPIAVMGGLESKTSSDQDCWSGFVSSFRRTASTIPSKQSGAQLTIFYGGNVNVYDDIPADKAQAIMLIASGENYSNYTYNTDPKIPLPAMKLSEGSGIHQNRSASRKLHSGLPIARKHSLKRFLENRKGRLDAKAKSPHTTAETENPKAHQHPSSSSSISKHLNSPPIQNCPTP